MCFILRASVEGDLSLALLERKGIVFSDSVKQDKLQKVEAIVIFRQYAWRSLILVGVLYGQTLIDKEKDHITRFIAYKPQVIVMTFPLRTVLTT